MVILLPGYNVNTKYLGITQDETMAVEILHYNNSGFVKKQMDSFCTIPTPFQPLANPLSCITALYAKNNSQHFSQMFFTNQEIFRCQYSLTTCPKCLDINNSTFSSSSSHKYTHMPRGNNTVYWSKETHPHITSTHHLQCYIIQIFTYPHIMKDYTLEVNISLDMTNLNMINILICKILHMPTLGKAPEWELATAFGQYTLQFQ